MSEVEVESSSNGVNPTSGSNTDPEHREVEIMEEREVEITDVYPNLYRAAAVGAIREFEEVQRHVLPRILTPNNNTILHISIASQVPKNTGVGEFPGSRKLHTSRQHSSNNFVKQILQKCPSLLLKVNDRDETPLHTAARCSDPAIVEVLFKRAETQHEDPESRLGAVRQMLGMVDRMNNTPLHVAAMTGSTRVVKVLTEKDPDFPYSANGHGQTPLYIASRLGDLTMVDEILQHCKELAHEGPNGQTALHAAAMGKNPDIIKRILEKIPKLSRKTDENGWTPLHYAAYNGVSSTAKVLLKFDPYAAYIKDKHREMTPLLLAAGQSHLKVVKLIVRNCPDCCEVFDNMGWNVLHFAMVSFQLNEVRDILVYPPVASLINNVNVNGSTPLHVLALEDNRKFKRRELMSEWEAEKYSVLDKRNMSAFNVMNYGSPELKGEIVELSKKHNNGPYRKGVIRSRQLPSKLIRQREKMKDSHLVVAALIATVTFAAAFTMPGGFKEEDSKKPGSAILSKNSAFQAFVITDAIAMILSLSAVFIHFILSQSQSRHRFRFLYNYESWFTMVSMGAMVIAFVTGTYAVVSSSLWVAIVVCVIGLSFFFVACEVIRKMRSMNGVQCKFRSKIEGFVKVTRKMFSMNGVQGKFCSKGESSIARLDKSKLREELKNLTSK